MKMRFPNFGRLGFLLCIGSVPAIGQVAFQPAKLAEMDHVIETAIQEKKCPGGVLWLEHGGTIYSKAYGQRAVVPATEAMTPDTIFDAASLTKVIACTPAVMLLIERREIGLDEPASRYLPEFTGGGKEKITIRHLLTHTSGLRPGMETKSDWSGPAAAIRKACAESVQTPPGATFRYSDINFIVLGEVVRRVSRTPLEEFVAKEIYQPLKMENTAYLPPKERLKRIAPTEVVQGAPLRGVVHDPTARKMGGVAGHAGLFTTAPDLARYARMLLNLGELEGARVFKPETVKLMTSVQTPEGVGARRGLGWDIDSDYSGPRGGIFPMGSYGHTGWTGTSLWIDPFSKTFVVFLSNRNHPDESGSVSSLRRVLGDLAAQSVPDFDFSRVPDALPSRTNETAVALRQIPRPAANPSRILNGIDVLARQNFAPLKGKKIGLITNHTGQDRERNPTIDLLRNAPGMELVALFSPEHGIRGVADEKVGDSVDERTGLPVFSLYGETRKPKPEQLTNVTALVFDIQDIGCRFYTYISTLGLGMEAAASAGIPFVVLDRVNPINGITIDGPVLEGRTSFVGFHPIPLRHGMTVGELAGMFNAERNTKAQLQVIELEGWTRHLWLDETGLPWSNPSPNIRNLRQATLYPGIGLLENALSVGRGTDTPFELVGAPYIEDGRLAEELNRAGLPGVRFVPVLFRPTYSTHRNELCRGVYISLTDRDACKVVDMGLLIAKVLHRWYPAQFDLEKISHLLLHPATMEALKADLPLGEIRANWQLDLKEFSRRRNAFLLY
jgi:uncharacterized protein YbbC (DUF1343 family)/CubicO group peptidase (beta-lactamase class C family)